MILTTTHKVALAGLIVVSIGAKVVFDVPIYYDHLPGKLIENATGALANAGFQTILNTGVPSLMARKDSCILTVMTARAQGGDETTPSATASGYKTVYWYRGALYDTVPRYRILFDRALQRLGVATGARPMILPLYRIANLLGCTNADLELLPLAETLDISATQEP